jgi:hypothetical protein
MLKMMVKIDQILSAKLMSKISVKIIAKKLTHKSFKKLYYILINL